MSKFFSKNISKINIKIKFLKFNISKIKHIYQSILIVLQIKSTLIVVLIHSLIVMLNLMRFFNNFIRTQQKASKIFMIMLFASCSKKGVFGHAFKNLCYNAMQTLLMKILFKILKNRLIMIFLNS
jgi:hypothetical protein